MNRIANLDPREREELFIITAREVNLPEAMIEKDFWVCWTLDYLFCSCPWAKNLAFKGGTSLSKCFGLIDRFSEDIDVILDWRVLGYELLEPWWERSRTKQDKFNKEANSKTEAFLRNVVLPKLNNDFLQVLTSDFTLYINDTDPQTICFVYPSVLTEKTVISAVRMEIGALAAWTPAQNKTVTSYAAQRYPQLFESPSTQILTVAPERTFWEKVTILHKEAFRSNDKFPPRYSRHYYDLYCMDKTTIKERAYSDLKLLERVVRFKDRFYPAGSAHYELAKPGTMRLTPTESCLGILQDDYKHMRNMVFGELPTFENLMLCIQRLEQEINYEITSG